jgi:hypothetical protein
MVNCPKCGQVLTQENSSGGFTWYKCTNIACLIIRLRKDLGSFIGGTGVAEYSQVDQYPKGEAKYAK